MKKVIALVLVSCMCLAMASSLTACGKKDEPKEPEVDVDVDPGTVAGGWTVNSEFGEAEFPEEAKEALDKAMEGYTGAGFTPVAYLGSQVVAGLNYAFLCKSTLVTAKPVTDLKVVTVYKDLDGNATIKDVIDVDVSSYTQGNDVQFNPDDFVGGYTFNDAVGCGLDETVQKKFDKAFEGFTGVGYTPLALLGSQVVAGANYAVLCKAQAIIPNATAALAVVVIYADLQDGAEITNIAGFEF